MTTFPCLVRSASPTGEDRYFLGHHSLTGISSSSPGGFGPIPCGQLPSI